MTGFQYESSITPEAAGNVSDMDDSQRQGDSHIRATLLDEVCHAGTLLK